MRQGNGVPLAGRRRMPSAMAEQSKFNDWKVCCPISNNIPAISVMRLQRLSTMSGPCCAERPRSLDWRSLDWRSPDWRLRLEPEARNPPLGWRLSPRSDVMAGTVESKAELPGADRGDRRGRRVYGHSTPRLSPRRIFPQPVKASNGQ